jgi:putative ABC transport system permease protein
MNARALAHALRMAVHDFRHERLLSLCAVFGLAAILSPILILFGVKNGIVSTMMNRLVEDPRNLEITPVGSGSFGPAWFARIQGDGRVAFVVPQTRSISATITLVRSSGGAQTALTVDLVPTAGGDPLLGKWGKIPESETQISVSEPAARKLGIQAGDRLTGRVGRSRSGVAESASVELSVAAVLPFEAQQKDAAFVRLQFMEAVESYRDGRSVERFGWSGSPPPLGPWVYPSFRLYAKSIEDVAGLRALFEAEGLEVYTRAEEIEVVRSLDRSFTIVFRLVCAAAVLGFLASTASSILANVRRKERSLGVIRLMGFPGSGIVLFPVTQAILVGLLGMLVSAAVYLGIAFAIDRLFSGRLRIGEEICSLLPAHFLAAAGLVLCFSVIASLGAAIRAAKIEPSEVIRDV